MKINGLLKHQRDADEKMGSLQKEIDHLKSENVKVTADMKVLRDEHTEVLHTMFKFERRNQDLLRENTSLRQDQSRSQLGQTSMHIGATRPSIITMNETDNNVGDQSRMSNANLRAMTPEMACARGSNQNALSQNQFVTSTKNAMKQQNMVENNNTSIDRNSNNAAGGNNIGNIFSRIEVLNQQVRSPSGGANEKDFYSGVNISNINGVNNQGMFHHIGSPMSSDQNANNRLKNDRTSVFTDASSHIAVPVVVL